MSKIIANLQDLRYLDWTRVRHSSGTAGSFLKAYDDTTFPKLYYKLSDFDPVYGIVGHECINEIIVDCLLNILNIPHLAYTLIHARISIDGKEYTTFLCSSEDYKKPGESKVSLEDYFQAERIDSESPMDFCIRMGWENTIYEMLLVDFLILNRDRHGANIEVLRNPKNHTLRLGPLFDHGLSFVCRCHSEEELEQFDVLKDRKVQSFIGSSSVKENLKLIPKDKIPKLNPLQKSDRDILMDGLDGIISEAYQVKLWKMLWKRWKYLEAFCNL